MICRFPFGRIALFSLITAVLFGVFGLLFGLISPFFLFYRTIAMCALAVMGICLVLWLAVTLFKPSSMFMPGYSVMREANWLDWLFCKAPLFRISILSLVGSLALFWIYRLVFPVLFTIFLVTLEMVFIRLLFFLYGSAGKKEKDY